MLFLSGFLTRVLCFKPAPDSPGYCPRRRRYATAQVLAVFFCVAFMATRSIHRFDVSKQFVQPYVTRYYPISPRRSRNMFNRNLVRFAVFVCTGMLVFMTASFDDSRSTSAAVGSSANPLTEKWEGPYGGVPP